jgi:WS/DGAT/MGAT family acyltransferase
MTDDPVTRLRGPLGPRKAVAWHDGIPLDRVKSIARALGGTINDVLMCALAAALGRELRAGGDDVAEIRTFVPVNLRPLDQPVPVELGNRFGLVFLALPVDHQPPRQRFDELKRRMDALKQSPEPVVTHAILSAVGLSPVQVERLFVDVFGAKVSLITTNVPGPTTPLVLAGAEVRRILFWVPQSGAVSLGVSLFSYAGRVVWGVSTDVGRYPDPGRLVSRFAESIDELEGCIG